MEAKCGNLSNSSVSAYQSMPSPNVPFFLIVLSIALAAVLIINGWIAIILARSTAVAVPVRVLLINLLVGSQIMAVLSLCSRLNSVALSLSAASSPSLPFCQFLLWGHAVTTVARLFGQVAVSAMVYLTVTGGVRCISGKSLACSLVVTWLIALLTSIGKIAPSFLNEICHVDGILCFIQLRFTYNASQWTYISVFTVLAYCVPLLACICISVVTLCYLKRHTTSEGAQYKKAMAKLAAFLLTGNVLNIIALFAPSVALASSVTVAVYLVYIMTLLSFFPTPILIVLFIKPVRKHLFCSKCLKDEEVIPMQQADTIAAN